MSGGGYALELGGNSAYLKDNNTLLLIDCCEDVTKKLKDCGAFDNINEIVIAITHTHADHVAGIGPLIWYCNFLLNIKPKIVSNSSTFENHLKKLLDFLGVEERFFDFITQENVIIDNCKIKMMPTRHTSFLECFGIMFTDNLGKYYFSGDTHDFDNIKNLVNDSNIKKIYCEASWKSYNAHIEYKLLKTIKCSKLILMHFEDVKLYNLAILDGFNVAKFN